MLCRNVYALKRSVHYVGMCMPCREVCAVYKFECCVENCVLKVKIVRCACVDTCAVESCVVFRDGYAVCCTENCVLCIYLCDVLRIVCCVYDCMMCRDLHDV